MRSDSEWMMMFAPVAMPQEKWPVLGPELTQPVNSTDINQLPSSQDPKVTPAESLCRRLQKRRRGRKKFSEQKYYEDSHIQTPKTLKGRGAHYAEFYDAADEAELGGGDSDDDSDYRDNAKDSAKDVIRRLSLDDAERDRGHYLEVRSHASLDKIAEFEGKRYRSDDSLQWLKRFIYEMKGTRMPQDSWCEPFSLCLGRAAKSCGYARTAKIQYGKGGADASDHVEHFLLNCGDDDIMDLLYPMRLDDIERVEKIINTKILGEKRKRQRDRLSSRRSRDGRRVESQRRPELTRLNISRKSEHRDDRRDDRREYRRDDRRIRRDDGHDRRVTVAVTSDDEKSDEVECQPSRRLGQLDYDDDDRDYGRDGDLDSEEESDHDYIDAGLANEKSRSGNSREDSARPQRNSVRQQPNSASHWNPVNPPPDRHSRVGRSSDRQDNYGRRGDSRERPQLDETGLSQSAEPVTEAKYIFAYVGEAEGPEDEKKSDGNGSDMDGIDGELGYSEGESPAMMSNADTTRLETGATGRTKTMRLLPGERLGWWSAQKFDRRVRMRALVMGTVNDQRTKILLDTGANISAINEVFARKLRLKRQASRDVQIGVQGIGNDKVGTSTRAWVKVTLGWEVSYEFEVWVMDHHAVVDLILGTDFMIPAGIRLDLYNSLAKLPDEVVVPLIKSQNSADGPRGGLQVTDGPTENICLPGRLTAEFRIRRRQPAESTHELWVRPHFPVLNWTPHGVLPPEGFVRLSSAKYRDWQVLAYEAAMDKDLLRQEQQLYDEWLERQPPAVERRPYSPPTKIARRTPDSAQSTRQTNEEGSPSRGSEGYSASAETPTRLIQNEVDPSRVDRGHANSAKSSIKLNSNNGAPSRVRRSGRNLVEASAKKESANRTFSRVADAVVSSAESIDSGFKTTKTTVRGNPPDRGRRLDEIEQTDTYVRTTNSLALEDYAHELAFLPDLTDVIPTQLDYSADNVECGSHQAEQSTRLVKVLQSHERIMISSGNALPPPAYGVVCDIDVQGHPPIRQRARRVPLKHLKKLYELLKALLKAGLIAFSNSPWASPIVIVLKKNGVDIRLCIDYKLVNAITLMMEYAMPLVDDLLTELDAYLWFCSLDAASGFWASDAMQEFINSPEADVFASGEPDQSSLIPVFGRRSFVDDICFGGRTFDECLDTLDRLPKRFAECRISVSFPKSIFVQPTVDFLSHTVTPKGIQANPKKLAAIAELPFPKSKKGMQAFLGALNYYDRFIQNLAVYGAVLYQLKEDDFAQGGDLTAAKAAFSELKKKVVEAPILRHFDSEKDVHIMLFANDWALSSPLMQLHDDKLHPVRFCGRVLKENEINYHPAEREVLALLQLLKVCYTQLAGRTLHVYTRFLTLEWVFRSKSLYGRAVSFAVLLSPHHLKIQRVRERDLEFAQLLQASITPAVGLDESLKHLAPPSTNAATVQMDPELRYASVPTSYEGHVLSFDGSAKTEKNGGYGSCSWILWKLPAWDIEIAASAHLPSTTVNIAEYTGMNNGVVAALQRGVSALIIVGDSRLAIQQSMGVIACRKDALQVELARHKELTKKLNSVRYLHVVRHYNSAADSMATEALEAKAGRSASRTKERKMETQLKVFENRSRPPTRRRTTRHETEFGGNQDIAELPVELGEVRTPDANDLDPLVIQAELRQRISKAQDEELRWADLKAYLKGEFTQLSQRRAHNAGKVADEFVLSEDGLLYRPNKAKRPEELGELGLMLGLVVPTTMIDEIAARVRASPTSKVTRRVMCMSEQPFHVVSMDFAIPLPRTRRGNTALLSFQDHFTGFVIAKAMGETGALEVAKAFEECIFRRFGAPSLIRHGRDPRFMSEVFQKFSEMMQSRSRATLSYRPQANGQQERSVKTMIQTVRTYVEDPLQADWDDIAEKLVHAINNSRDSTRRETPFYLAHGWDARSTLKAMTESIRQRQANTAEITDAAEWRREANRQREVALYLAAEFQRKEKARRAKEHNDTLSRVEKRSIPVDAESPAEPMTTERSPAESPVESATTERLPAESPAESESTEETPAEFPAESVRSSVQGRRSSMAVHGTSEAWADEEASSPVARAVQSKEEGRRIRLWTRTPGQEWISVLPCSARISAKGGEGTRREANNSTKTRTQ
ncbi:unnamed protein product [Phytophthora fragariaefolia]|uniref:Unnamed protein product n=1 Tax=Phytophthora fragariaefolia TaxID=1490495 RepID=A0A9W7CSI2_9STRA|nr:unnamed protein product [Phytophthora fragariaefolia]